MAPERRLAIRLKCKRFPKRSPRVAAGTCHLGSIKANIGHLEAAAGIAGLAKVLLQLKHRTLVPSLHAEPPNSHIDFAATPLRVVHQAIPWTTSSANGITPRRVASVSSFGAGGSNAHAIVAEAPAVDRQPRATDHTEAALLVVSAHTRSALKASAVALAEHLEGTDLAIADVAFTLQTGREAMRYRLAVIAEDTRGAVTALTAFAHGEPSPAVVSGEPSADHTTLPFSVDEPDVAALVRRWWMEGRLSPLARAWVHGFPIDWSLGYEGANVRRVSLPGYPFEREALPLPLPVE